MSKSHWKLFRLNEFDTVAAPDFESAVKWYMEEHQLNREETLDPAYEPHERSLMSTVLCLETTVIPEEERSLPLERVNIEGDTYVRVTLEKLLEQSDSTEPFVIATFE